MTNEEFWRLQCASPGFMPASYLRRTMNRDCWLIIQDAVCGEQTMTNTNAELLKLFRSILDIVKVQDETVKANTETIGKILEMNELQREIVNTLMNRIIKLEARIEEQEWKS